MTQLYFWNRVDTRNYGSNYGYIADNYARLFSKMTGTPMVIGQCMHQGCIPSRYYIIPTKYEPPHSSDDSNVARNPDKYGSWVNASQYPGCCGIGVIHDILNNYRFGCGVDSLTLLYKFAFDLLGHGGGYSVIQATHLISNPSSTILKDLGFRVISDFTNRRTTNHVMQFEKRYDGTNIFLGELLKEEKEANEKVLRDRELRQDAVEAGTPRPADLAGQGEPAPADPGIRNVPDDRADLRRGGLGGQPQGIAENQASR